MISGGHATIGNKAAPRALLPADVKHRSRHAAARVGHSIKAFNVRRAIPLVLEVAVGRLTYYRIGNCCGRTDEEQ